MRAANCPVCSQEVFCTHPMQTIKKQMENHLRTHGLKGRELQRKMREIGL